MKWILASLIILVLFGVNVWLYKANQKTPLPEGCENIEVDCTACGIANCAMRKKTERGKEHENS